MQVTQYTGCHLQPRLLHQLRPLQQRRLLPLHQCQPLLQLCRLLRLQHLPRQLVLPPTPRNPPCTVCTLGGLLLIQQYRR